MAFDLTLLGSHCFWWLSSDGLIAVSVHESCWAYAGHMRCPLLPHTVHCIALPPICLIPPPLPPPTPCQFLTMAGFPGGVCRAFQVLRVHSLQHVVSVYYCGTAYIRRALGCVEYGNSGDNPGPGSV